MWKHKEIAYSINRDSKWMEDKFILNIIGFDLIGKILKLWIHSYEYIFS